MMSVRIRIFLTSLLAATLVSLTMIASPQARANGPDHVFQIYLVRDGDTLARVAERFGVSARAIRRANRHLRPLMRPGQRLRIPIRTTPRAQTCPNTYHVRRGDTIERIAQRCHLAPTLLRAVNGLGPNQRLSPGQRLHIPVVAPRTFLPWPTR